MKKLILALASALPLTSHAQQHAPADSITTALDKVVVTADTRIETSEKIILRPTALEKSHSTNGYALLENMNLPDFNVNAFAQTIATSTGRDVRILVNGVEVQPDELATLPASGIVRIDCRHNPGGRYAGCGAVINFITERYDYGGNIYLSADEGVARQHGEYTGMANYRKNAVTLTLTANGKWDDLSQLNSAENTFALNDGVLHQSITPAESKIRTNSQYLNFKLAHAADNHAFDISLALTRSAKPVNLRSDNISYTGLYEFQSLASRSGSEHGVSPVMKMHYNLFLPGGHTIMANANIRHGHTNYRSMYSETGMGGISNGTVENNILACATLGYFHASAGGLSLGITLDEYYNRYADTYSGSFNSRQTLTNYHSMAMLHCDHTLPFGLSWYTSAGITDLYSTIGSHTDNQFSPMAFYGLTYAVNPRHSVSVTGSYTHSIYNPAYKNNADIHTSFFEATTGNPDLRQVKAFQNFTSYNGRAGHLGISFTHDYLKYFGNTSNRYFAENNIMYHTLVNDGTFHYHKLTLGISANLVNDRLRLRGNATYSMNLFDSEHRPAESNDWRADFSASYMMGDWQVKGTYALPYSVLGFEGIKVRHPAQYGLSVNWQHGDWAAQCRVANFLDRRISTRTYADYGVYRSLSESASSLNGRDISLSVTYTFSYGKKTDRGRIETESDINSAILRPF